MLLAVHHRVMEHLGSLESTQETRVALGYASSNSYPSFVLSKLPACSITRWCTLKHEPIVNLTSCRSRHSSFLARNAKENPSSETSRPLATSSLARPLRGITYSTLKFMRSTCGKSTFTFRNKIHFQKVSTIIFLVLKTSWSWDSAFFVFCVILKFDFRRLRKIVGVNFDVCWKTKVLFWLFSLRFVCYETLTASYMNSLVFRNFRIIVLPGKKSYSSTLVDTSLAPNWVLRGKNETALLVTVNNENTTF